METHVSIGVWTLAVSLNLELIPFLLTLEMMSTSHTEPYKGLAQLGKCNFHLYFQFRLEMIIAFPLCMMKLSLIA